MASAVPPPPSSLYADVYKQNPSFLPSSGIPVAMPMMEPPTTTLPTRDQQMLKFQRLAGQYEIRYDFCEKLRQLEGFDITIICDDSGSMNTPLEHGQTPGAFSARKTRYDELREYTGIVIEIASCLDQDGLDIYFLNKPSAHGIHSLEQLTQVFTYPPSGSTPLVRTLHKVFQDKQPILDEKKQLIIIATDGEPDEGVQAFKDALRVRPRNTFISIIACTEDEGTMRYLNELDVSVPGVDVVDDYHSEVKEVKQFQGSDFVFSFGDYVVKTLLGPIDPYFDELDEKRNPGEPSVGCCSVS